MDPYIGGKNKVKVKMVVTTGGGRGIWSGTNSRRLISCGNLFISVLWLSTVYILWTCMYAVS